MKKVIIIGAGPAGLSAGYKLLKESNEYEVIILEATKEIGGISKTVQYNGNRMDIGGHRFFTKDKKVQEFWNEVMPLQGKPAYDDKKLQRNKKLSDNGPDPEKDNRVMLIRNRVSRIYYDNKFFDYPVSLKWLTIKNLGFFKTIQSGFSYLKSTIFKKKEDSLENFYINRFGKKLYSMFFEKYTEKLWGRHPKNISADWGAQRVKGLSIKAVIKDMFTKVFHLKNKSKETSLIEEFSYPKYGPGDLWENVSKDISKMGGKIYKDHEVKEIEIKDNKIISVTCNVNGRKKKIIGDIFISSMPLKDFINGIGNEAPQNISCIANGLPYRDFITLGVLVNKLKLKNETKINTLQNMIPDCWIYVQESNVKMGRIQIFNNWSPYMVKNPNETIWIGLEYFCNENDELWNMSEEDFAKLAIDELIKMNIIEENAVLDYHREKVKKAYPAYFDTYNEIDTLIEYLNTFENLYCVGRNGQHRYNNMDHSVATAFETVKNILEDQKDKSNIWNVNTENVYHEEIKEAKKTNNKKFDFNIPILCKKNFFLFYLLPFVFLISAPWFIDNDSWFLFNHGRYILEQGFPTIEPFTIHKNLSFIIQQWGFAVILWSIKEFFGFNALFWMTIIFLIILIFVVHKLCMLISDNNYKIAIPVTSLICSLLVFNGFITTRPQIVTYILITLFLYFLERYFKTGNKKNLFVLPLISIIQINMHASMWPFLFIYSLPFIAEAFIEKIILKKDNKYKIKTLLLFIIICVFIAIINPYKLDALTYFFKSFNKNATVYITEMKQPSIFTKHGISNLLCLIISFSAMLYYGIKNQTIKLRYIFLFLGSYILALMTSKSIAYLIIFALYPLAFYLKDFLKSNPQDEPILKTKKEKEPIYNKIIRYSVFTVIIISISISFNINLDDPEYMVEEKTFELFIEKNKDRIDEIKMYCDYSSGNYLQYLGIKTYIDTRAEVFYKLNNKKEEIFDEYIALQSNQLDIENFLKKYNFTHLYIVDSDYLFNTIIKEYYNGQRKFYNYEIIENGTTYFILERDDWNQEENNKIQNDNEKDSHQKEKASKKNNNEKKSTKKNKKKSIKDA